MTELNEDMKSLDPCPPEEFLRTFATRALKDRSLHSVILSHLEFCPSCKQQVREFKGPASSAGNPIAKGAQALRERQLEQQRAVAQGPTPGTIWRTVPESEKDRFGPLVLVLQNQGTTVTVAEISEDIAQAIHTDMVLEPHESALRFRCMIRTGNTFNTATDSLTLFVGTLSPSLIDKVRGFCKDAERFDENIPLSKFVFLKDSHGREFMRRGGITSGLLVTSEDDPRLGFLEQSKARTAYLSKASMEPLSEKVVSIVRKKNVKWFVKRILPLAAMIAVVVVGGKVFFQSEDKPAPEDFSGVGLPSRPLPYRYRLEIGNPLDPTSGREVHALMAEPVDAGADGAFWLLNRASRQIGLKPSYYLRSRDPAYGELSYAFFPTDHLLSNHYYTIDWTCDSILLPHHLKDEDLIYALALQSLISLALDKSPEQMSDAFTKATAHWALRYFRPRDYMSGHLKASFIMVEDFEKDYRGLYEWLARPVQGERQTEYKMDYWDRLISEIVSKFPKEAAKVKDRYEYGELPQGPIRLVLYTLVVMEAFPDMANKANFSGSHGVPEMYSLATERLRLALKESLGNEFEDKKKLAERVITGKLREAKGRVVNLDAQGSEWVVVTDWGAASGN